MEMDVEIGHLCMYVCMYEGMYVFGDAGRYLSLFYLSLSQSASLSVRLSVCPSVRPIHLTRPCWRSLIVE
jgi:hypothetical protein